MRSEIVEAFQRVVRDTPDRSLLYVPAADSAVTAAGLWRAAEEVCRRLDAARVNQRGLIVAALGNRVEYLATFLACRMRGQPLCPLDAGTTASERQAVAARLGASAVLTLEDGAGLVITTPDADPGDSRHGNAALLKMTSGSTGAPRATLTPEAALVIDSRTLMPAMQIEPDAVQLAAIPLSHAYAIGNLVGPLFLFGQPLVLRETFVPHRVLEDARRFRAAVFPGVPFMFDHFSKNPPSEGWPPTLRTLISAGAALDAEVGARFHTLFGVKVHPFYGTSETGGITFDATDEPAGTGFVGTPLPGVSLELVPHEGAAAHVGRVSVRGPAVIHAYADGVDGDSFTAGAFLTGDLGSLDAAGHLTLSGRISSFVNVAGRKVQPDEVERVLRLHDDVNDVRVVGVADDRRGEQLVACIVTNVTRPSVLTLRQFCAARLASYKIPRAFVFVDAIPLTERGKTDRQRLLAVVSTALIAQTDML